MANLEIRDGDGLVKYLKATGTGTDADPFYPWHNSLSFSEAVALGQVPGAWYIDKFGYNPLIATNSDPEDIWELGGTYQFSTSADIVSLSSSNDTDTQTITVIGQTLDGTEVTQTKALQGQTRVALDTPLWRVYGMSNAGPTTLAGVVYCYSGTESSVGVPSGASVSKAAINNGFNQTQMCIYTVPKAKVAFLYRGEVGMYLTGGVATGTQYLSATYQSRRKGINFFTTKKFISLLNTGSTTYMDKRPFPDVIPAGTDIKLTGQEVSDDMGVWGTFDMMILDESLLTDEFLASIGQEGY